MKVDTKIVAEGVATVERMIEDLPDPNGIGASTLRIVVGEIAGVIKRDHPRFDVEQFAAECTPISKERQRLTIASAMGETKWRWDQS